MVQQWIEITVTLKKTEFALPRRTRVLLPLIFSLVNLNDMDRGRTRPCNHIRLYANCKPYGLNAELRVLYGQLTNTRAGCIKNSVGQCRSNRRSTQLARPTDRFAAIDNVRFDDRGIGHPH